MKKLLVAIAVVASIGVTLLENNVMSLNGNKVSFNAKYNALATCCTSEDDAAAIAEKAYNEWGYSFREAIAL